MKRWGLIICLMLLGIFPAIDARSASPLLLLSDDANTKPPQLTVTSVTDRSKPKSVLIDIEQTGWKSYRFIPELRGFDLVPLGYLWDFGDGRTADVESPKHHYSKPGVYEVTLSITDRITGYKVKSAPMRIEISFFHLKNAQVWFLMGGIVLLNIFILYLLRSIRRRKEAYFHWSNKTSEHPVLIRRKRKPYMKNPPKI